MSTAASIASSIAATSSLTPSARSSRRAGLGVEAVEDDAKARVARLVQDAQQVVVGPLAGVDLEHDPRRIDRKRADGEQELARDVHVHGARAGEAGQADVAEGVREQSRGGLTGLAGGRQQLERDDSLGVIEDRLPGDDDRKRGVV